MSSGVSAVNRRKLSDVSSNSAGFRSINSNFIESVGSFNSLVITGANFLDCLNCGGIFFLSSSAMNSVSHEVTLYGTGTIGVVLTGGSVINVDSLYISGTSSSVVIAGQGVNTTNADIYIVNSLNITGISSTDDGFALLNTAIIPNTNSNIQFSGTSSGAYENIHFKDVFQIDIASGTFNIASYCYIDFDLIIYGDSLSTVLINNGGTSLGEIKFVDAGLVYILSGFTSDKIIFSNSGTQILSGIFSCALFDSDGSIEVAFPSIGLDLNADSITMNEINSQILGSEAPLNLQGISILINGNVSTLNIV